MIKRAECLVVLGLSFFVLLFVAGCAREKVVTVRGDLVSDALLEAGGLRVVWQTKLPIRTGEDLERLMLVGGRLYALSSRNYLVSLNRNNGATVFSRPIARPGLPVVSLADYGGRLISVVGNRLVEINPWSGEEIDGKAMDFRVVCPAARNSGYYYIGGADKRVHVLEAEDKLEIFEVAANNESAITSIIADDDFVVFATDAGNVVRMAPDKRKQLWHFKADDGIVGPMVRDGRTLLLASRDASIYKIDVLNRRLIWRYQTEAILERSPRVTARVVYQYVDGKGLFAIDKRSGKSMWRVAEGVDLLAEWGSKAYVISNVGTIVVMDNKKVRRLYSVNAASVSKYVTNVADSRIYIADEAGRIACLEPVE